MKLVLSTVLIFLFAYTLHSQDVELYQQFNGRYDYTAIGNTLNIVENAPNTVCDILTTSSSTLTLQTNQIIQAAYLYWAGSGDGDLDITLNGIDISAERTFSESLDANRVFFAAFTDVTDIVIAQGNGDYTISNLDLTTIIPPYCPTGTNFSGWAITIIYQDDTLPLNQVNVYDGLQSVPTDLTITLDNLNVFDNVGAKIGFIAWEGDNSLAVNEQLTINGNVIGNPPLNPTNNAFNGTNSFTGETNLYNMDIDFYSIQNNINIGDTTATIQLTSGQDFVMINNIITVLNSQLPDATIVIDDYELECNSRNVTLDYTVYNVNSTASLPANTPIAFYVDTNLIAQSTTQNTLPIGGSENGTIALSIPESLPDNFILEVVVDDDGIGNGTVSETNEVNNNSQSLEIELLIIPPISALPNILECDVGFNTATFDLTIQYDNIETDSSNISFYTSEVDVNANSNQINVPEFYNNTSSPQTIYIRVENSICYEVFTFIINVENCPVWVPDGISPNGDNLNDDFTILGLRDIFENFELKIFNRYGDLIYQGDNSIPNWNGKSNRGFNNVGKNLPVGTYFYILYLNDPNYSDISGWVYLNN